MVAYITDDTHTPTKWQENVTGADKATAIVIVEQDRWAAEQIPNGEGYEQKTINEGQRIYLRTSKETGNSWEVKLDEGGISLPNPCGILPPDARDFNVGLMNAQLSVQYQGQDITMVIKGTAIPPTA